MKNKKILKIFLMVTFVMFISILKVNAAKKVKVYMFEAGGCPYCDQEKEYLESLDTYGKKFELIIKELYVDHIDWEEGKDYQLGVSVAKGFKEVGFTNVSYTSTPFIVISDLYADNGLNLNLESVINEAYEKGDKDIVNCYIKGKKNCLRYFNEDENIIVGKRIILITIISCLLLSVLYTLKFNVSKKNINKSKKK